MLPRIEQVEFKGPDSLIFGRGTATRVGEYGGGSTAMIVTDTGIRDAGLLDDIVAALESADATIEMYDAVQPDPSLSDAATCAAHAESVDAEVLIGIGGGSSLDVTKAASVIVTNDAPPETLLGRHNVAVDGLPTVLLPTTAGTGSEVSPTAVLFDDTGEQDAKAVIIDDALFATAAIVDPDLSMQLPAGITRATGLDAFAHAMGSYMSTTSNTFADALCMEAMELIETYLRDATFHGADAPEAREKMALAATLAMLGRINGGKAAIHSIAYGIQELYDVPHAEAIAMVLPEVVAYNQPAATDAYARLGTRLYEADGGTRARAQTLVDGVYRLRDDLGLDRSLRSVGAEDGDIDALVEHGLHSQRHIEPNPRPLGPADAETIFREVW